MFKKVIYLLHQTIRNKYNDMNTNITLYNFEDLLNIAKNQNSRMYLYQIINRNVDMIDFICIELEKINRSKWQVTFICTEHNNYNLCEEEIYLTSTSFDIKKLNNAKEFTLENQLGSKVKAHKL